MIEELKTTSHLCIACYFLQTFSESFGEVIREEYVQVNDTSAIKNKISLKVKGMTENRYLVV